MVNNERVEFDQLLYAISDSTRRRIIDELVKGERSVGELSEPFRISAPAITKHLRVLRENGLITMRRQGRNRIYSLQPDHLMRIETWLAKYHRFWAERLAMLEEAIRSNVGKKHQGGGL